MADGDISLLVTYAGSIHTGTVLVADEDIATYQAGHPAALGDGDLAALLTVSPAQHAAIRGGHVTHGSQGRIATPLAGRVEPATIQ